MARARSARIVGALCLVAAEALGVGMPMAPNAAFAAIVDWPVSTLVVSEIQTGGASASDEFVEVANQGSGPVDLAGLEVVYATASGSTVTRKATWASSTILEPGRRVLIANASGVVGAAADLSIRAGSRRPAGPSRCGWSAGRSSTR